MWLLPGRMTGFWSLASRVIRKRSSSFGQMEETRTRDGSIGPADETESKGYVAVRVADLVQGQPRLQDVLSLPVGSLVADRWEASQIVLDADYNVLWPTPVGDAPAPTE